MTISLNCDVINLGVTDQDDLRRNVVMGNIPDIIRPVNVTHGRQVRMKIFHKLATYIYDLFDVNKEYMVFLRCTISCDPH